MRRFTIVLLTLVVLPLAALSQAAKPAEQTQPDPARILVLGDSMMIWHAVTGRSVGDQLARALGEPVIQRAIGGARIRYGLPLSGALGMSIPKQFYKTDAGRFDWVVMNGGGNDLWFGCGCNACDTRLAKMISPDGASGDIPAMVARIRASGARVLYLGYLRSPGIDSAIDACAAAGDTLEARLAAMAKRDRGVYFLSNTKLVPHGDASYHGLDMVHPSIKGSAALAQRAAGVIRKYDKTR